MAQATVFARLLALLCATTVLSADAGEALPAPASLSAPKPLDFLWEIRSWDLPEGREVTALALSPDAARIVIGGNGTLALLDRETGREFWRSHDGSRAVEAVHFSSDGRQLVVAGGQSAAPGDTIALVDAENGRRISSIAGNRYATREAVLSPDGRTILSCGGSDYSLEGTYSVLWDTHTGELLHQTTNGAGHLQRNTHAVVFFPDGERYLCVLYNSLHAHETRGGKLVSQLDDVRAAAAAISPHGDRVVICGDDSLIVWDIARSATRRISTGQQVGGTTFISDDVCITWGVELRMWNVMSGEEISWSGTYESDVRLGATAGKYVVGSNGRRVRVWGLPGVGTAPPNAAPLAGSKRDERSRPNPPLVTAAERGDPTRVAALLARGADVNAMRGSSDRAGTTALHVARDYTSALALLDAGAEVNARSTFDWNRTPLHSVIERYAGPDTLKIIDLLLERGARIEDTFGYDETPLQQAATSGHKDLATHLIAKGAHYDIFSAAALGDIDRVRALLTEKPDLALQRAPTTRRNALYWARTTQIIHALIQAGAQTDIQDAWGATPEHDLRGNHHEDLADYLRSELPSSPTSAPTTR